MLVLEEVWVSSEEVVLYMEMEIPGWLGVISIT